MGGDRSCLGLWSSVLLCCTSPEVLHTSQLFQILKRKCQWFKVWCSLQSYFFIWVSWLLFFSPVFLSSPFFSFHPCFWHPRFLQESVGFCPESLWFQQCTLEGDQCRKISMILIPTMSSASSLCSHTLEELEQDGMTWNKIYLHFCLPRRLKAKTNGGQFLVAFLFFYNAQLHPDERTVTPKGNRQSHQNYSAFT